MVASQILNSVTESTNTRLTDANGMMSDPPQGDTLQAT
jgi:hypothetical protein